MPYRIKYSIAICLTFVLFWVANSKLQAQDTGRELRWNLKAEEKLEAILTQDTNITTKLNNRTQEIGNKMTLEMDWEVKSADSEKLVIQQSIRRIQLTINAPGKGGVKITTVDTNSKDEPSQFAGELLQQVRPLIGTNYLVTVSPRGEITEVEIPKPSMEVIREAPASMQIRNIMTKEGLIELFGQSAIAFPEKAISAGDTWNTDSELKTNLGDFTKTVEFTYSGSKNLDGTEYDEVNVATTAKLNNAATKTELDDFSGSGKLLFSADADKVVDSQWQNSLTTSRTYRDKIIQSTVQTTATLIVNRK